MTHPCRHALALFALVLPAASLYGADPVLDLSRAVVLTPAGLEGPENKAVHMLVEEVEKRTLLTWQRAEEWPAERTPVVVVGPAPGVGRLLKARSVPLPEAAAGREGYRIGVASAGTTPVVWVAGNDARGVLFGVGRLLRELRLERRKVTLPAEFRETSAPCKSIRGHQLGYRPKTNSYDGWTVAQWEQYIRDLAVFGCNAIELIPPRSDDDADSPHFPLPPLRMMTEISKLADAYGLDVWVWYPAMDRDYANPATVEFALKEWGEVFRALPRLDAVFVPGGDPGHTRPDVLMALLEKQTANLRRFHPRAAMWVSPQGFNARELDAFLTLLRQEPAWLAGVVHGPQVRLDLPAFRAAVPARYPVRDYPDITHNRHCQYPVPDWDVAFAIALGREGTNPRPTQMAAICRRSLPHTAGFITYSEGCHDDVNKIVWSALGWDDKADVPAVLRQYARYFIAPAFEERFAQGLLGLEQNWVGATLDHPSISETFGLFRKMEQDASPMVKRNWRFQQALYRAYYDAFVRARLRYEMALRKEALDRLGQAPKIGAARAMTEAEAVLDRAVREPVAREQRARVFELAEALFQSIHAQLSVPRYQAIAVERGATLDSIDWPLTDAGWLKKQFAAVRQAGTEEERLAKLEAILHRDDPGPGGFYDDLGDPKRQPHLVRGPGFEKDPAFYETSLVSFSFRGAGPDPSWPRSWWQHAEPIYDAPLVMSYDHLDPNASYRVRVVYARERPGVKARLVANDRVEIHGYLSRPLEALEFDIPQAATAEGRLKLSWNKEPGSGGTGRGCQVAEVWLLKK